ncbi:MAG: tRNA preQ1(34) S-adenosylmethionine ribosyltransferase-isomerase QueA [Chloroflexi bacterium]|nr:tRNA preQ1(34) S-adenosylmethionine ribosyltransferase-isomerase QueA [Chloroflexota bacterium]
MKVCDFDYHLPTDHIAQTPVEPRDSSRLMVLSVREGTIQHRVFREIEDHLLPGDVLVCNESRVIPARIYGRRIPTGGRVEVLLIARRGERTWEALVKPGRRMREGGEIELSSADGLHNPTGERVRARIVGRTEAGGRLLELENRPDLDMSIERLGAMPLPPYIHARLDDPERYQTVYARIKGSVAAPTAGLHFTPSLIERLQARGVELKFVTLHIGLDTFRPVQVELIHQHHMHSEFCELTADVAGSLNQARAEGRRIVAVGTTTVRVLESAAQAPAKSNGSASPGSGAVFRPYAGWTDIFIYPGYRFKGIDALITNFHLPRSTLLMLVSAFAGTEFIRRAYAEAVERGYRFYSFGDALLIG